MSKRSRDERRKRAELKAGNANAQAPPLLDPPRPNLVQGQIGADPVVMNQRPVWLTRTELRDLIELVESVNTQHRLLPYLKQVRGQFDDADLRRREVEATAMAVAFWMEGGHPIDLTIKRLKAGHKKRHLQAESRIACLPPAEMRKLLAQAANGVARPRQPEDGQDGGYVGPTPPIGG